MGDGSVIRRDVSRLKQDFMLEVCARTEVKFNYSGNPYNSTRCVLMPVGPTGGLDPFKQVFVIADKKEINSQLVDARVYDLIRVRGCPGRHWRTLPDGTELYSQSIRAYEVEHLVSGPYQREGR